VAQFSGAPTESSPPAGRTLVVVVDPSWAPTQRPALRDDFLQTLAGVVADLASPETVSRLLRNRAATEEVGAAMLNLRDAVARFGPHAPDLKLVR
jgi:hypothetical protein